MADVILWMWGLSLLVAIPYVSHVVAPRKVPRMSHGRNPRCSYEGCEAYWFFIVSVNGNYRRACFEHAVYAFALYAAKMIHHKP